MINTGGLAAYQNCQYSVRSTWIHRRRFVMRDLQKLPLFKGLDAMCNNKEIMLIPLVSKELDTYGYKFKMSFVIPAVLSIYIFSKNKNVIGYRQKSNRTFLVWAVILFGIFIFKGISLCSAIWGRNIYEVINFKNLKDCC